MVNATIVPDIGRVKNTVQSFEKLIIVFMKASSAIGPRITPSTERRDWKVQDVRKP